MTGALMSTRRLVAGYGEVRIVSDLEIEVRPGEVVALLGANGAGKTTTMLTLAGQLAPLGGEIDCLGATKRRALHQLTRDGLAYVSEERSVFSGLTTRQNIGVGRVDVSGVIGHFPELERSLGKRAGLLSGGEQQMLTLGRALARDNLRLLLADELSLGLAPKLVGRLLGAVRAAADAGLGALLIEQHVHRVLDVADRVYVLGHGRLQFSGTADEARARLGEIESHYLSGPTVPPQAADGERSRSPAASPAARATTKEMG
jgi:branched-chain amino acid transport system ATP-binding protein